MATFAGRCLSFVSTHDPPVASSEQNNHTNGMTAAVTETSKGRRAAAKPAACHTRPREANLERRRKNEKNGKG